MSLVLNMVGGGIGKPSPTDAVLRVTAPSGSTVTIKKGTGASVTPNFYLDGTDTDTFFFYIKASNFGTYTVTATNGTDTETKTVVVADNIEYSVRLSYPIYLIENGIINNPFLASAGKFEEKREGYVSFSGAENIGYVAYTATPIDVTSFNTYSIETVSGGFSWHGDTVPSIAIGSETPLMNAEEGALSRYEGITLLLSMTGPFEQNTIEMDISNYQGTKYLSVAMSASSGQEGIILIKNLWVS